MRLFRTRAVPRGTYTEWHWPSPAAASQPWPGYAQFEHVVVPEIDPGEATTYFWAHQFHMVDGDGGYVGLQTRGERVDGTVGKVAIFSMWEAVAADGPGTMRFSGEGSGWSCRIPYDWEAGRPYRLRVASLQGQWWEATVEDGTTGTESLIGKAKVPEQWQRLATWSVMWTEYYGGALGRCRDLPYSRVVFHTPTALATHGAGAPTVSPERRHDHLGTGTCSNSRVTVIPEGARHEMGFRG